MKKAEEDYERLWKPLMLTDGKFDEQKIKNEMVDLIFIFNQVSKVYSALTEGLLSKPMYYADVIIEQHNEAVEAAYEQGYSDAMLEARKE